MRNPGVESLLRDGTRPFPASLVILTNVFMHMATNLSQIALRLQGGSLRSDARPRSAASRDHREGDEHQAEHPGRDDHPRRRVHGYLPAFKLPSGAGRKRARQTWRLCPYGRISRPVAAGRPAQALCPRAAGRPAREARQRHAVDASARRRAGNAARRSRAARGARKPGEQCSRNVRRRTCRSSFRYAGPVRTRRANAAPGTSARRARASLADGIARQLVGSDESGRPRDGEQACSSRSGLGMPQERRRNGKVLLMKA